MNDELQRRLDQILPRVTTPKFVESTGIGNEIACYIFDYPAREELRVRTHLAWMDERLKTHHPMMKVLHLNLLTETLGLLEDRKLLTKSIEMQQAQGDQALAKALKGALKAEKLRNFIAKQHTLTDYDLVLMSGVGGVWPMVRAHSLLNCLHTVMGTTPLVMFYPGEFDGVSLRLFDEIEATSGGPQEKNYYRAFALIPREKSA
jgi:hypothetical protein